MTYTEIMERLYLEMAHVEGVIATDWESSQIGKEKLIDQLSNLKEAGYLSLRKLGNLDYRVHLDILGIEWNERRKRDIKNDIIQATQSESVIDTNKSVRQTNRLQKWSLIITGLAIVASCIFQALTWSEQKSQLQLEIKKQESDSLKEIYLMEKIHSIQKQLDAIQNEKNPSVKPAAPKNNSKSNQ